MGFFPNPKYIVTLEVGLPGGDIGSTAIVEFINNEVVITYKKSGFTFKNIKLVLKPNDIFNVNYESETFRSGGKAAAGAIVGGLLTGGVGLLAGAALGGRQRQTKKLSVEALINGVKTNFILVTNDYTQKIFDKLTGMLAMRDPESKPQNTNIIQEINHLQELKEKGIITEKEFETIKSKIIN